MTETNLSDLAGRVERELRTAGLSRIEPETMRFGGFAVTENPDAPVPLVAITWHPSHQLLDAAMDALSTDPRHATILHMGTVKDAMSKAMLTILRSAGFDAGPSQDDLQPGVIEVRP